MVDLVSTEPTVIGLWITVVTGIFMLMVGVYSLWRTWWTRRREKDDLLKLTCGFAVRVTDARYVRPILHERLVRAVQQRPPEGLAPEDLFCRLLGAVVLTEEEKRVAFAAALDGLVVQLRSMPSPPVCVHTAANLQKHRHRLEREIEAAYQLRPRLSAELIDRLARFAFARPPMCCGGGGGGGHRHQHNPPPPPSPGDPAAVVGW